MLCKWSRLPSHNSLSHRPTTIVLVAPEIAQRRLQLFSQFSIIFMFVDRLKVSSEFLIVPWHKPPQNTQIRFPQTTHRSLKTRPKRGFLLCSNPHSPSTPQVLRSRSCAFIKRGRLRLPQVE
ncbi:hypothetical protein L596_006846 [Steinernema carpocapsae]|uniref:Uncharacterized protein n=1 Tax=Steinernema carpocapsae TaxID=34508 RepID=A0A4U5P8E4_STECR|nr:hypothetical protein L596_006846 [Steinernema carpocapsae]